MQPKHDSQKPGVACVSAPTFLTLSRRKSAGDTEPSTTSRRPGRKSGFAVLLVSQYQLSVFIHVWMSAPPAKTLCPASDEVGTLSNASESKWQEWTVGVVELQWLLRAQLVLVCLPLVYVSATHATVSLLFPSETTQAELRWPAFWWSRWVLETVWSPWLSVSWRWSCIPGRIR